jgi:hypothetical protein
LSTVRFMTKMRGQLRLVQLDQIFHLPALGLHRVLLDELNASPRRSICSPRWKPETVPLRCDDELDHGPLAEVSDLDALSNIAALLEEPGQHGPNFLTPCQCKHNLPGRLRVRPSSDRNGIT